MKVNDTDPDLLSAVLIAGHRGALAGNPHGASLNPGTVLQRLTKTDFTANSWQKKEQFNEKAK
jgi:hypothetical protein